MNKLIFILLFLVSCSNPNFDLPKMKEGSQYPRLVSTQDGGLLMSWFEKIDSVNWSLNWSEFQNKKWSISKTISSSRAYFVNWADFPSIYHIGGDSIAAHWLERSGAGTYDYDIKVVTSYNRGESWSSPQTPHNDGTLGEHGFLSFFNDMNNDLGMIWLDGRNMSSSHSDMGYGAMNLYQTSSNEKSGMILEKKLDGRVCECCPTSAVRTQNSLIFAYRDRGESEIRDINIVRCTMDKCDDPYPVYKDNWKIAGCPVNGPMLASDDNNVAIAWYTAPNNQPMVNLAFSNDEGVSFESPIRLDMSKPIGRVDLTWISPYEVMASWIESSEQTTNIVASIISRDGSINTPYIVSEIQPGRVSGYPQMEKVNNQIMFAWTELENESLIISKWLPISAFR